jgi:hypothetical protein
MTAPVRFARQYYAEFDGPGERVIMADSRGAEYYGVVECGRGGKDLVGRRQKAIEAITNAITRGWPPGLCGIFVSLHTLDHAKRVDPERYGTPAQQQAGGP